MCGNWLIGKTEALSSCFAGTLRRHTNIVCVNFWKMYNYEEPNLYKDYLTKISEKLTVEDLLMVVPVFLAVFVSQILNYAFMGTHNSNKCL